MIKSFKDRLLVRRIKKDVNKKLIESALKQKELIELYGEKQGRIKHLEWLNKRKI